MGAAAIAALIAQLLPLSIQLYNEIEAANPGTVQPLATILAAADADWDAVAAQAKAQLAAPNPVAPTA